MREYKPKDDVQKKSYYNDRFYVAPQLPKEDPATDEVYSKDMEALNSKFEILEAYIQREELVVYVDPMKNVEVLEFLKDELDYGFMMEMSAVDFLAKRGGFEVFYEMLSLSKRKRIRLKAFLPEGQAIETIENLFRSANFAEREMYDMFGIVINNHSFLKRILMPDDWEGYPLRKTYPLQGDEFAQWYEVDKIFGKEARDIIGPEIRDSSRVDRYDTERFARLGHEVPMGTDISEGEPDTPVKFQEDGGAFLVEKFTDNSKFKTISEDDRRNR